jgi:hypothetical protein
MALCMPLWHYTKLSKINFTISCKWHILLTIWHHNARYVQREKSIGESFILGKIFLPRNPDLQEQHFHTSLKLKDLYPRKLLKMRVTFFSIVWLLSLFESKNCKSSCNKKKLMPPYVKNKTKCTLILEIILTSVSD